MLRFLINLLILWRQQPEVEKNDPVLSDAVVTMLQPDDGEPVQALCQATFTLLHNGQVTTDHQWCDNNPEVGAILGTFLWQIHAGTLAGLDLENLTTCKPSNPEDAVFIQSVLKSLIEAGKEQKRIDEDLPVVSPFDTTSRYSVGVQKDSQHEEV